MPTATMSRYKLGKHPARFEKNIPQFGKYLTSQLPAPPDQIAWQNKVTTWPMMGNDTLGDCTCAAAGHMIESWTANAQASSVIIPDAQIEAFYNHFSHGNADAGANMIDVLKYWHTHGLDKDKISAFAQLEPQNQNQAMDSVYFFGACYIGLALPNFAVAPNTDFLATPWVVPPQGATGDAAPNQNNGHCVPAVGYDQRNLYVVTWGALKSMSWQFYTTYMEEAFAVLSPDFLTGQKSAPNGFDLAALQADLQAL
ncbi:MAG TPA: hypothetical protein VK859_16945 [bacterium]|jgi:hypothetical protein|nr:hypothetical protein [bacterium]